MGPGRSGKVRLAAGRFCGPRSGLNTDFRAVFTVACLKVPLFLSFFPPPFQIFKSLGYNRLVLQIGRGKVVPEPFSTESFALDVYRYKDSLKEDLQKADLVISHAGKVP